MMVYIYFVGYHPLCASRCLLHLRHNRSGCFAQGGDSSVKEDTSVLGYADVTLFGRGVEDVEVDMYLHGPGGKHLRSFICSAPAFDS